MLHLGTHVHHIRNWYSLTRNRNGWKELVLCCNPVVVVVVVVVDIQAQYKRADVQWWPGEDYQPSINMSEGKCDFSEWLVSLSRGLHVYDGFC